MKTAEKEKILIKFASLPSEAQKEVADFISFLQGRYKASSAPKRVQKKNLTEEKFIGIWRNRTDIEDSTGWVRDIRKREWSR